MSDQDINIGGKKPCGCEPYERCDCNAENQQPNRQALPESSAAGGYTASQQLDMLCEILRNVNNGVMHLNAANFDHAALDLEVAASKLRTLSKAKAV